MRISHIHIREYNQFKDFTLDLRYPADHPTKAGKPLDKVCFIGYSGTGKTSLLKLLRMSIIHGREETDAFSSMDADISYELDESNRKVKNTKKLGTSIRTNSIQVSINNEVFLRGNKNLDKSVAKLFYERNEDYYKKEAEIFDNYSKIQLMFFPSEYVDIVNPIASKMRRNAISHTKGGTTDDIHFRNITSHQENIQSIILDFQEPEIVEELWTVILVKVQQYKATSLSLTQKIAKAFNTSIEQGERVLKEYKDWQLNTLNPIVELAEKLDPLLKRFYLKVDTEFDFQTAEDLIFIKLKTTNGAFVPYQGWSTGTKQLLLTAIPLIKLDTSQAIICLDEPERSIFPDLQRWMMDYYTELAPKAQFFVATHSPIIAAQFEPCERFILEFTDAGTICAKRGTAPIGADPNVLLYEDFGQTSLLTEQGLKHYERYLELHSLIRHSQDEKQRDILVSEYLDLAHSYKFPKHKTDYKTSTEEV